jgi:glycosyltransferase involved in cell wall biosynthesis
MADAPLISVLMPVYNGERYLDAAVRSILAQTLGDFELIVVDDGSTDRSLARLQTLERGDARIRLISRPNTGIVGALNDAIAAARGRYVARLDGDDIATPDRFARQIEYLQQHPECVCLGSAVVFTDPLGVPQDVHRPPLDHDGIDALLLKGWGGALIHPVVMMRADAVRRVGGYDKEFEFVEDVDLFLKLAEIGKVANLPDVLLHYRQHLGSTNRRKAELQSQRIAAMIAAAYARRGLGTFDGKDVMLYPPIEPLEQTRRWGWGALRHGHVSAARKHAWSLVRARPLSGDAWKLMLCSIRGR